MEALTIPKLMKLIPDDAAAYEFLEKLRWNGEPVCPHCGSLDGADFIKPRNGVSRTRTDRPNPKPSARRLWQCKSCRQQYSVLTGTIMHGTKVSIKTWVFVIFQMVSCKNGFAAAEIQRSYGLSQKTAWFMAHRIREAMKRDPMGGLLSGVVVADETFIGGAPKNKHHQGKPMPKRYGRPWKSPQGVVKTPVLALVSKETGEVRSQVVNRVTADALGAVIREQVNVPESTLHTDASKSYRPLGKEFIDHQYVDHSSYEYVRGEVSTNILEGYFSQLKRSIDGTHHHVSVEHLHRYLCEFDFRYTTHDMSDTERMERLVGRVGGKRISYKPLTEKD